MEDIYRSMGYNEVLLAVKLGHSPESIGNRLLIHAIELAHALKERGALEYLASVYYREGIRTLSATVPSSTRIMLQSAEGHRFNIDAFKPNKPFSV